MVPRAPLSASDSAPAYSFFFIKLDFYEKIIKSYLELVSKELNHLAAILHVYAGGLNFMK